MMKKLALAMLLCCAAASQAAPEPDAFFRAVSVNNASGVRSMLAEGMNPNQPDAQRGDIPLVLALRDDADRVFQVLLDAPGIDIEARSANGNTALMMAAYKHKLDAVNALLAKGAKVNQSGWTALHYAASAGDLPIMKILLARARQRHPADVCRPRRTGGRRQAAAVLGRGRQPEKRPWLDGRAVRSGRRQAGRGGHHRSGTEGARCP
jgi:ankyrin repeat protein